MISRFGFASSKEGPATGTSNWETKKNELSYGELESLIKLVSSEVQLQGALQKLLIYKAAVGARGRSILHA